MTAMGMFSSEFSAAAVEAHSMLSWAALLIAVFVSAVVILIVFIKIL